MAFDFFKHLTEAKLHSHMSFQDMDISVEVPAGGARTGVNKKTGETWEHKIDDHYGYIKGTHSPDGEHLDCYVRKNPKKDARVYVVHQLTVDGSKFDEDKVMLGYGSAAEAKRAFKKFTFKPDTMFGGMTEFELEHFLVIAYQASNSKAMLTDRNTYNAFVKQGLMPKGIHSPIGVARRVCESLSEAFDDIAIDLTIDTFESDELREDLSDHTMNDSNTDMPMELDQPEKQIMTDGFVVAVHTQIMENIGSAAAPQWATAGSKYYKVAEAHDFGEARSIAARVAAGEIPVEIAEGEYVLGIDAIPMSEYRQFYEAADTDEVVEESIDPITEITQRAGVVISEQENSIYTPRDWADRLAALEERRIDPAVIEAKKAKKDAPRGGFVGWPWWYPHSEHSDDGEDAGDMGGGDGGMGESSTSLASDIDPVTQTRIRNLEMMWGVDQRYIDKHLGTPRPECTCEPYQLRQVGCDCDQEAWEYAKWVDQQRKKFGLSKAITEGSFKGMSLDEIYAEIINTDYFGVDMTETDYAKAEAKAEEIWNSYQS